MDFVSRLINPVRFCIQKDCTFATQSLFRLTRYKKFKKNLFFMAELMAIASQIRRDIVRMVHGASSGHPGGSLGCADFLTALYFKIMKHDPAFNMDAKGEDVFFLSNGHISPLFYSVLARSGYFDVKELATFRKINSRLQGHPATHEHLPGVRIASGSLGQGMSVAIGAALTKKLNGEKNLFSHCMVMGNWMKDKFGRLLCLLHIIKWIILFLLLTGTGSR